MLYTVMLENLNARYHDHFSTEKKMIAGLKRLMSGLHNVKFSGSGEDSPGTGETIITVYKHSSPVLVSHLKEMLGEDLEVNRQDDMTTIYDPDNNEQYDFTPDKTEMRIEMPKPPGKSWRFTMEGIYSGESRMSMRHEFKTRPGHESVVVTRLGEYKDGDTKFLGAVKITMDGRDSRRVAVWFTPRKNG